jgi:AcrR family transcriptional regulator
MQATERRSSGRPTKEQAAAIDDRVLDGARLAFCENGIVNSSLDQIAQDLGISKHTIYRRYRNKEALLDAVVQRDVLRFREALAAAGATAGDPLAALEATARCYFAIGSSRDYAAFYLSLIAEAALSKELRGRLAGWAKLSLEPMVRSMGAVQGAGLGQGSDIGVLCETLIDLLEGACNRIRLHDEGSGLPADPEAAFAQRWAAFAVILGIPTSQIAPAHHSPVHQPNVNT